MGGHVDAGVKNPNEIVAQVEAKKARNLAVAAKQAARPTPPTCPPSPRRATSSSGSRCAAWSAPADMSARGREVVAGHAQEGDRDQEVAGAVHQAQPPHADRSGRARRPTSTSTASTPSTRRRSGDLGRTEEEVARVRRADQIAGAGAALLLGVAFAADGALEATRTGGPTGPGSGFLPVLARARDGGSGRRSCSATPARGRTRRPLAPGGRRAAPPGWRVLGVTAGSGRRPEDRGDGGGHRAVPGRRPPLRRGHRWRSTLAIAVGTAAVELRCLHLLAAGAVPHWACWGSDAMDLFANLAARLLHRLHAVQPRSWRWRA